MSCCPEHFASWVDWAKATDHGLDFNQTLFSHELADDGFTLSHQDAGVRQFWIDHCIACRDIGAYFGAQLGEACITNLWIPDGYKDMPADRLGPRQRLLESLDAVYERDIDPALNLDAVECKLFGLGSESYVVGSHEFYLGYAVTRNLLLCLDAGHFHPTETIADKLSSVLLYVPEMLLHVSRGVRWDSDHVVTLSDDLQAIMQEIVRCDALERVHIGLDFFDASINRVGAWAIGTRNGLPRPADGAAGTARAAARIRECRRFHRPAGAAGGAQGHALWRGLGIITARRRARRWAWP